MCGILGTNTLDQFKELFEANIERGNESAGIMMLNQDGFCVKRFLTQPDDDDLDWCCWDPCNNYHYILGHCQSATGDRVASDETTHPFENDNWVVAHNGVIQNIDILEKRCGVKVDVDSKIILELLNESNEYTASPAEAIVDTCSLLKGTFGLWVYHKPSNRLFITRQGSTIYVGDGSFSSACTKSTPECLPEGAVKELTIEPKWKLAGTFQPKSPFYIPI
tara:strand:- start:1419 stop:2081 length:663 start_codon:yes stop_codon:yes gene_type:complete